MRTPVIILIVAIVLIIIGAIAAIMMMGGNTTTANTLTANGTKVDFQNNNTQAWTHVEFVLLNVTNKNGTTQNIYGELWLKPGENETMDLSNSLGYGNTPLPVGSVVRMDTWTGLFNSNNTGTGTCTVMLEGWSNTIKPVNATCHDITNLNVAIGPLPSGVSSSISNMDINPSNVNTTYTGQFNEVLLTQINNDNLNITITTPGGLSQTIAELI